MTDILPTKRVKKWNTDNPRLKVSKDYKPTNPFFCPVIHEDTGKRCGNILEGWNALFYEKYSCCQECFEKYNPNVNSEIIEKIKQGKSIGMSQEIKKDE